jgi:hypothetical protein
MYRTLVFPLTLAAALAAAPGTAAAQETAPPAPAAEDTAAAAVPAQEAEVITGRAPAAPKRTRSNPSVISEEQITASGHRDAFMLIHSMRPNWLRVRGSASMNRSESVRVYVDGVPIGGPRALNSVRAESIRSIQHLSGPVATQRFGSDHGAGAILITMK